MGSFVIAFILSPIGRWLVTAGLAAALIFGALFAAYQKGRASVFAEQQKQSLEAQRTRVKIDDEVTKLPTSDLDIELRKWMRDGK
jgi:hypothetical protein